MRPKERRPREPDPADYEPPRAEDIDTTQTPAEMAAAVTVCETVLPSGLEESDRWH